MNLLKRILDTSYVRFPTENFTEKFISVQHSYKGEAAS